MIPVL